MTQSFSEVDIVRKGLATMADQDTGDDDGVVAITTLADRAPRNSATGGACRITIEGEPVNGSFSLIINGEETDAIPCLPSDTLRDRTLEAINALAVTQGSPLRVD